MIELKGLNNERCYSTEGKIEPSTHLLTLLKISSLTNEKFDSTIMPRSKRTNLGVSHQPMRTHMQSQCFFVFFFLFVKKSFFLYVNYIDFAPPLNSKHR